MCYQACLSTPGPKKCLCWNYIFIKRLYHLFPVLFFESGKTDTRVAGYFAAEVLMKDQVMLGAKEEWFEFIFHKLFLWNLNGVLSACEHAYRVVSHYDPLPLVVEGDKVGTLQKVDPVMNNVNGRNNNSKMVFGEPELGLIKPGKKYDEQNDQCKYHGHYQPAQPDSVSVSLVINFHWPYVFAALF